MIRDGNGNFVAGTQDSHFRCVVGCDQLNPYLEVAIQSMKLGERCLVEVEKADAIGLDRVEIEVEIIRFGQLRKDNWDLNSDQRKQKATDLKSKGTPTRLSAKVPRPCDEFLAGPGDAY